jgi:hypothetical protein
MVVRDHHLIGVPSAEWEEARNWHNLYPEMSHNLASHPVVKAELGLVQALELVMVWALEQVRVLALMRRRVRSAVVPLLTVETYLLERAQVVVPELKK